MEYRPEMRWRGSQSRNRKEQLRFFDKAILKLIHIHGSAQIYFIHSQAAWIDFFHTQKIHPAHPVRNSSFIFYFFSVGLETLRPLTLYWATRRRTTAPVRPVPRRHLTAEDRAPRRSWVPPLPFISPSFTRTIITTTRRPSIIPRKPEELRFTLRLTTRAPDRRPSTACHRPVLRTFIGSSSIITITTTSTTTLSNPAAESQRLALFTAYPSLRRNRMPLADNPTAAPTTERSLRMLSSRTGATVWVELRLPPIRPSGGLISF